MSSTQASKSILETELTVLRALCQGTRDGSARDAARRLLKNYHWRKTLHQVVFEILVSFPSDAAESIREELPSRLTRRGFPEFDLEEFFKPHSLTRQEVGALMRQLAEYG